MRKRHSGTESAASASPVGPGAEADGDGEDRVFDARPLIAAGVEPFGQIMDAVSELREGQDLVILAPFEPVPLEGVLGSQGFTHDAQELGGGTWSVRFSRGT